MCGLTEEPTDEELRTATEDAAKALLGSMLGLTVQGITRDTLAAARTAMDAVERVTTLAGAVAEDRLSPEALEAVEKLLPIRQATLAKIEEGERILAEEEAEAAAEDDEPTEAEIAEQAKIEEARLLHSLGLIDHDEVYAHVAGTVDVIDPNDVEGSLRLAVEVKRPVVFVYHAEDQTAGPSSATRKVSPYEVKPGSHGPLLFGYDHDREGVRNFRIDLIESDPGGDGGSIGPASQFVPPSPALTGVAR